MWFLSKNKIYAEFSGVGKTSTHRTRVHFRLNHNVPNDLPRPPHCGGSPMRSIPCAAHSHRSSHLYLGPADRTVRPIVSPALDRTHRSLDSEPVSNTKGTEFSLRPYETAVGEYARGSELCQVVDQHPTSQIFSGKDHFEDLWIEVNKKLLHLIHSLVHLSESRHSGCLKEAFEHNQRRVAPLSVPVSITTHIIQEVLNLCPSG